MPLTLFESLSGGINTQHTSHSILGICSLLAHYHRVCLQVFVEVIPQSEYLITYNGMQRLFHRLPLHYIGSCVGHETLNTSVVTLDS